MTKKTTSNVALKLTRVTRTVYFFAFFYGISIVIFDAGNLITRDAVIDRWTILSMLLIVNSFTWLLTSQIGSKNGAKQAISVMITTLTLLLFAGLSTYWGRGMASTSTIFYVLPLLVVATLKNRHALLATATLAATTYAFATVKYFNDFFNEGFRVQLWGSLFLYGGTIFVCSWLIMILTDLRRDSK